MEEILASIRQIISEDGAGASAGIGEGGHPDASATTAPAPVAGPTPYEAVVSRPEAGPTSELTPRTPLPNYREPTNAMATSRPAVERNEMPLGAALPAQRTVQEPGREAESALLSPEKSAAISGAFGTLAQTLMQNSRTLEEVVADTLQPMLKSWLDDNLPSLVERMVREEIERVSRGRR